MGNSGKSKVLSKKMSSDSYQLALMPLLAVNSESVTGQTVVDFSVYNNYWFLAIAFIFLLAIIYGVCIFIQQTKDRGILKSHFKRKIEGSQKGRINLE